MIVADAPVDVQKQYTSPTKPTHAPAAYQRPISLFADGTAESITTLRDVSRLASDLRRQLDVLCLEGTEHKLAAELAALPGDRPGVAIVPAGALDDALAKVVGLVALIPKRRNPVLRFLIGSVHERLLARSSAAILALPSAGRLPPIARVLFPADLSPRTQQPFEETIALCKALNAELHLLHVYGEDQLLPSERDMARRAAAGSPHELMMIDQEGLHALARQAESQGIRTCLKTAEGRAHTQILAYTNAHTIDLISMASHGPRSSEDILLGSTTMRVIQKSPVAVLAVRT